MAGILGTGQSQSWEPVCPPGPASAGGWGGWTPWAQGPPWVVVMRLQTASAAAAFDFIQRQAGSISKCLPTPQKLIGWAGAGDSGGVRHKDAMTHVLAVIGCLQVPMSAESSC